MTATTKPLPSTEVLRRLFVLDHETGALFWCARPLSDFREEKQFLFWNRHLVGKRADHLHVTGYRRVWIQIRGTSHEFYAHRLVWKIVNGEDPVPEVDHIDRNRSNNRPDNLRQVSHQLNMRNASRSRNQANPLGVYLTDSGKFRAQLRINGSCVHLGTHPTKDDAIRAIVAARSSQNLGA